MSLLERVIRLRTHNVIVADIFPIGQGLILLLSGPPGTGKTLTAEAGRFTVTTFVGAMANSNSR
jgi:SpoVK/Ycf46/Vps4 family AAA+-type ATPase